MCWLVWQFFYWKSKLAKVCHCVPTPFCQIAYQQMPSDPLVGCHCDVLLLVWSKCALVNNSEELLGILRLMKETPFTVTLIIIIIVIIPLPIFFTVCIDPDYTNCSTAWGYLAHAAWTTRAAARMTLEYIPLHHRVLTNKCVQPSTLGLVCDQVLSSSTYLSSWLTQVHRYHNIVKPGTCSYTFKVLSSFFCRHSTIVRWRLWVYEDDK